MQAFTVEAVLKLLTSEFDNSLNQSESKASAFGTNVKKGLSTVAKVSAAALAAASAAVVKFGSDAVNTGMEFDTSMSQVYATMGDKANEMVEYNGRTISSMEALRDFALEMGKTTQYTASQSADALNYMALAGYDAETSMAMLPNVMALASAGAFDLATASDMVTDTQTAFGISLDRTGQMVDEMAKAASTGNTSVEQLGNAFLTVGGLAQELNGGMVTLADGTQAEVDGIQELEIALTAMANAGIKGSEAGTHMRNMLLKLSSPTSDGVEQLEKLGVKVFDTEGNMRSLKDVMGDLSNSLGDLTQEQKIQAISDLFNTRDLASAEALLNAVGTDWDEIGEAILNAEGAAKTMQDVQLDNLAGDVTIFKSALDGAKIAISDRLTPSLRELVQFGTKGVSDLTNAFQNGGLEGAATALGNIASDGAKKLSKKLPTLLRAGKNLITSLVTGITKALPSVINMAPEMFETFLDLIFSTVDMLLQELPSILDTLSAKIPEILDTLIGKIVEYLPSIIDGLVGVVVSIAENASTIIQAIIDKLPDIISDIIGALIEALPSIIEGLISLIVLITTKTPEIIAALIQKIPEIVTDIVNELIEHWPEFVNAITEIVEKINTRISEWGIEIWNKIKGWVEEKVQAIKDKWNDFKEDISAIWDYITGWFEDLFDKIGEWLVNVTNDLRDWKDEKIQAISDFFSGIWDDISEWFEGLIGDVVQWLVDITTELQNWKDEKIQAISDFFTNIWNKVSGFFTDIWNSVSGFFISVYTTVSTKLSNVWNNVTTWFGNVKTSVSNFFSNIWTSVSTWFSNLVTRVSTWVSNIWNTIKNKFASAWKLGDNLVTGLWNGISGAASWLWNKITGWLNGIWDGIKSFFGIHSPSKQMAWAGQMLAEGLAGGIDKYADEAIDAALDMADGINNAIDLSGTMATSPVSNIQSSYVIGEQYQMIIDAFKDALSQMKVELDDEEMGRFVDNTITRVVYNY